MPRALAIALLFLGSCAYVSKAEYDEYYDADEDGWPIGEDCDDNNGDVYPFAPDLRGDGCDADCGEELDSDGDDWPDVADCEPNDPDIHPCSANEFEGDDIDSDCDGLDSQRPDTCPIADPDFDDAPSLQCAGASK